MSTQETQTYFCVFKKGETRGPVAMFLYESDQLEWHLNPELFSNARRRIATSERPIRVIDESEIERVRSAVVIAAIRFSEMTHEDCYEPMMELDAAVKAYKALRKKNPNA